MKKLIVVATLLIASVLPVSAETATTCYSTYGSGEVCGESTVNVKEEHNITEVATGANDAQVIKLLLSIAFAATIATGLYKLTYKSYIFG